MTLFIKKYLLVFSIFFIFDSIWLVWISPGFYKTYLPHLLAEKSNLGAALLFYLVFILGLLYFVIEEGLQKKDWKVSMFRGGFFGLVTYSTFDLTSQAVFRDWPSIVTIVDLTWGIFICMLVSSVSTLMFLRKSN